jgi:alkanesulfonate monooxygenase SsuD/methylene tetrahydromethanopterin reductase-like flavin-dependent oxidoreductase (luciferase family)
VAKTWLFDLVHYPFDPDPGGYDAKRAAQVFQDHLSEWERADELGFDGLFLGEHHFTAYNLTPSPNVMLAAAAERTRRMRLGIMANIIPFHQPLRLAEELAMLDLLTDGRLECGFGRGVDVQEFIRMKMPFEEARPRFEEGLELIVKSWTQARFSHDGRFFQVGEGASSWPRPLQQPHPRIWITALSPATIQWCARQGYAMSSIFLPVDRTREAFDVYDQAAREAGQPAGPDQHVLCRNVFVADTMEEACAIAEPALNHLFGLFYEAAVKGTDFENPPPDYQFYSSFFRPFADQELGFAELTKYGLVIVGDPASVRDQIIEQAEQTGIGHFMAWMNFGNLAPGHVLHSEELYARDVLPALHDVNPVP